MILTAELTFYPFQDPFVPPIKAVIARLQGFAGVRVQTFPTASVLLGEDKAVMEAIRDTMAWSHQEYGRCVFVAKFLPGYNALD